MFSSVLLCACCIGYGTTTVYGAEDGGSAAQDDAIALVQYAIRATDVDAPKSATNLSKSGSRWKGEPVPIEESGGYKTGYPKISESHKKCFLSKASLFSAAGGKGSSFKFKEALSDLQSSILDAYTPCRECHAALTETLEARTKNLAEGTPSQTACNDCYRKWNEDSGKSVLSRDDSTAIFKEQEPYMNDLAWMLSYRGVSLYLDFEDRTAEGIIGEYRTNGLKWPPNVIFGVTEQLRRSVERATTFVHWEGAGGEYCMIEKAAATVVGLPMKTLRFPPIGDKTRTEEPTERAKTWAKLNEIKPEICRRDPYDHSQFAERVCELCGGFNCENLC